MPGVYPAQSPLFVEMESFGRLAGFGGRGRFGRFGRIDRRGRVGRFDRLGKAGEVPGFGGILSLFWPKSRYVKNFFS